MKIVRCPQGHCYDSLKYLNCPFCAQVMPDGTEELTRTDNGENTLEEEICPSCGELTPSNQPFCRFCRQPLAGDPFPALDEQGNPGRWTEDLDHCPDCMETYLLPSDLYCRFCGARRSPTPVRYFAPTFPEPESLGAADASRLRYACPGCGMQWVEAGRKPELFCPNCGGTVAGEAVGFALVSGGVRIPVPDSGMILGRNTSPALPFTGIVSREQLQIERRGKTLVLTDIGRCDVYLNGVPMPKQTPVAVGPDAVLRIDGVELTLQPPSWS